MSQHHYDSDANGQQAHGARCTITHTTDRLQIDIVGRPSDDLQDVVQAAHTEYSYFSDEWAALEYTELVTLR
ncbi:hypothetical protein ACFQGT_17580 [Natrialbaceae archaeon GCM10025810]|uniref:hypothetical protein n=1 Tax=Halovalidus salilacus TaxID=3075124 RepID=UPI00361A9223